MTHTHQQPNRRPILLRTPTLLTAAAVAFIALATCQANPPAPPPPQDLYTSQVQPILRANCYSCHGAEKHKGGLRLDTRAGILAGGEDGAILTPGHPEQSLIVSLIRREHPDADPPPMPPKEKDKLSDADIATITRWIKAGAIIPEK
ncbi:MAG: c-type cytochrome domain-containing protein [Acidobacteriota bacterium]